jgi:hypothetical protein
MTKFTEIPDVKYSISEDGNLIDIEQGQLDPVCIQLHRIHFDHIANKLGIPSLTITAETIRRRLEIVEVRINALAEYEHYRKDIIEHCGSGLEFINELDAVCEIASEFLKDISQVAIKDAN